MPIIVTTVSDNWAGSSVAGAPQVITNSNFNGMGITVKSTSPTGSGLVGNDVRLAGSLATPQKVLIDLGQLRNNVAVTFDFLGTIGNEKLINIMPAFDSVTGAGTAANGNTEIDPNSPDGTVTMHFAGPIRYITYTHISNAGSVSAQGLIAFDIFTGTYDGCGGSFDVGAAGAFCEYVPDHDGNNSEPILQCYAAGTGPRVSGFGYTGLPAPF